MHIEWLQVKNVRNLSDLRIEPSPALNVICGPNGSGKTALLEAIYLLSRSRSFRTPGIHRVIRHRQEKLQVSAGLRMPDLSMVVTGVERSRAALTIRYNSRTVRKVSEQAAQIPVITITQESHRLVSGSPRYRRRWLDWAMFHVKQDYIETWRDYYKALKNRNSLLRKNRAEQLGPWEKAMWREAEAMTGERHRFISELSAEMERAARQLLIPPVTLTYNQGWQSGVALDRFLAEQRRGDAERGMTRYGLHRSDISVFQEGREIGHFCSRGQIKLCLLALSLALGNVFRSRIGRAPIVLLDDLPAELDSAGQQRAVQALAEQGGQVFITTTDALPAVKPAPDRMFHVEQGQVVS